MAGWLASWMVVYIDGSLKARGKEGRKPASFYTYAHWEEEKGDPDEGRRLSNLAAATKEVAMRIEPSLSLFLRPLKK